MANTILHLKNNIVKNGVFAWTVSTIVQCEYRIYTERKFVLVLQPKRKSIYNEENRI